MADDAVIRLGYDNSKVRQGAAETRNIMGKTAADVQKSFAPMTAGLGKAFAAIGGTMAIRGFASEMGGIVDLATRFGTTAESIQRVGNSAQLAGTDIGSVAKLVSKLTIEAAKGSAEMDALGISASAFANANLEDQVLMLAGAYEQANGDQTKMVHLMNLLGGGGQQILPMLSMGVQELRDEFARMPVVTEAAAKAMAAFDDRVDLAVQQVKWGFGVMIEDAMILHQSLMALANSDFSLEKFKEEFDKMRKAEEDAMAARKPKRKEFDPEAFEAGTEKGNNKAKGDADEMARAQEQLAEAKLNIIKQSETEEGKINRLMQEQNAIREKAKSLNENSADYIKAQAEYLKNANEISITQNKLAKDYADTLDEIRVKRQKIRDEENTKELQKGKDYMETLNEMRVRRDTIRRQDKERESEEQGTQSAFDGKRRKIIGYQGGSKSGQLLQGGTFDELFGTKKDMTPRNSDTFNEFFHPKGKQSAVKNASTTNTRMHQASAAKPEEKLLADIRDGINQLVAI
jgi:hypothetical protein